MNPIYRSSSKQCVFLETGVRKQQNHLLTARLILTYLSNGLPEFVFTSLSEGGTEKNTSGSYILQHASNVTTDPRVMNFTRYITAAAPVVPW